MGPYLAKPGKGWGLGLLWSLTEGPRGQCVVMSPDPFPDPPQPGREAPSLNTSCHHFPLLVHGSLSRVDLFNGLLGPVQVTALHVTRLDNVTVAHMGTADGRILQVGPPSPWLFVPGSPFPISILVTANLSQVELARSLNYLLYVSNFSLGCSGQPMRPDVSRLGDHLFFASGDQVRWDWVQAWGQSYGSRAPPSNPRSTDTQHHWDLQ